MPVRNIDTFVVLAATCWTLVTVAAITAFFMTPTAAERQKAKQRHAADQVRRTSAIQIAGRTAHRTRSTNQ
jgi:hypothetical protein